MNVSIPVSSLFQTNAERMAMATTLAKSIFTICNHMDLPTINQFIRFIIYLCSIIVLKSLFAVQKIKLGFGVENRREINDNSFVHFMDSTINLLGRSELSL